MGMERSIRFERLRFTTLAGIAVGLACSECGNSTSTSGGNPPGGGGSDQAAPLAVIQFPPAGCLTDAAQVRLVIAVTDDTGVASVRARGVNAVLDSDLLWKVTVPLVEGDNTIQVETRDTLGNASSNAARVSVRREGALWIEPSGLAFDELAGEALVLDPALRTLFRVDLAGVRSVVSGAGVGGGPSFANPRDVDHVESLNAAIVTDGQLDSVILVDLSTGDRTTLSSASIGGGPPFLDLHGIAVDAARNRALVVDDARAELMAVDLGSGERTTISANSLGSGPSLIGPRRIGIDIARNRALVTLAPSRSILAVDLANGNRTVLSGGTTGGGPAFVTPFDLVVDLFRDRALVADPGARAVFAVDLATGARAILSSRMQGIGPELLAPVAVALHLGGAPLVLDNSLDALLEVGALTGVRTLLSGFTRGSGPQFERPAAMSSGLATSVVADPTDLFTVRTVDGFRALVSGPERGGGAPFVDLVDVVVSPANRFTVLDAGLPGLVGVDRVSGGRTLISGEGRGAGPAFSRPRALFGDSFVMESPLAGPGAILRVDPSTGERTVVSDPTHGSGPALIDPVAMDADPRIVGPTTIASVLDAGLDQILSVDLTSGDRTSGPLLPANIGTPTDMVLDFNRGRFLVTAADPPALVAIGGPVTILSDATRGAGPLFGRPEALELVSSATLGTIPSTPIAFVLDSLRGSILAVDLETGDRMILTK